MYIYTYIYIPIYIYTYIYIDHVIWMIFCNFWWFSSCIKERERERDITLKSFRVVSIWMCVTQVGHFLSSQTLAVTKATLPLLANLLLQMNLGGCFDPIGPSRFDAAGDFCRKQKNPSARKNCAVVLKKNPKKMRWYATTQPRCLFFWGGGEGG